MNVHPRGKQAKMIDTVIPDGELQSMVDADGVPKGLKLVLEECGVGTTDMVGEDKIKVLSEFQDFREECPAVYTYLVQVMKYRCILLPYLHSISTEKTTAIIIKPCHMQFHLELNPIERC